MIFDWPYYTMNTKGQLVAEDGTVDLDGMAFASAEAAERYLVENDIRGTVR